MQEGLNLSYKNSCELNKLIDHELPDQPRFICEEVTVDGQTFELYRRDVVDCIRSLFGNPDFAPHLILAPERHYTNQEKTCRVYHDMHTGQWWWETQARPYQFGVLSIMLTIFTEAPQKP